MPATTTLRRAEPQDGPALFLLARTFATSFIVEQSAFESAFEQLLTQTEAFLAIAETEEEIVGYVLGFDHLTFFANGRVAWVEEIIVSAEVRRQGIGRQLMAAFEDWARAREAKMIALATRRASPFYFALGFEESAQYFRKPLG
jgi:GNAT superfamily N-acetyltransferase